MSKVTETPRNWAFLLSEANGTLSRDELTIASGAGKLTAGTVLGKITASGKYIPSPNAEVTGKEGAQTGLAVLAVSVDATSADVKALCLTGVAEIKKDMLFYDSSVNDATKKAAKLNQLRAVHINAR